jgi:NAD(P)H-hydrate epimerase
VGGSVGKSGSVALTGLGALTAGCGLVTVATPETCVASVAAHAPELMQLALPADVSGEVGEGAALVEEILDRADVLVVGPGLGTGDGAAALLGALLEHARVPMVLDADALNIIAASGMELDRHPERPIILTPHPGELERFTHPHGPAGRRNQHERLEDARKLSTRDHCVVVLKGYRTVVVGDEPHEAHVITTGGPGMGTAGVGDVLAGMIGGLLAQGLPPRAAAVAAAHLHGRAGDLAEKRVGQMSLRASDVLRDWPAAVESVLRAGTEASEGDED